MDFDALVIVIVLQTMVVVIMAIMLLSVFWRMRHLEEWCIDMNTVHDYNIDFVCAEIGKEKPMTKDVYNVWKRQRQERRRA